MKNKNVLWSFKTIDNPDKYFKEINIEKYHFIFGLGCLGFLVLLSEFVWLGLFGVFFKYNLGIFCFIPTQK